MRACSRERHDLQPELDLDPVRPLSTSCEFAPHKDVPFSDLSLNKTALAIYGQPWQSGSTVVSGPLYRCRAR